MEMGLSQAVDAVKHECVEVPMLPVYLFVRICTRVKRVVSVRLRVLLKACCPLACIDSLR